MSQPSDLHALSLRHRNHAFALALSSVLVVAGCSEEISSCEDTNACQPVPSAGTGGSSGSGGAGGLAGVGLGGGSGNGDRHGLDGGAAGRESPPDTAQAAGAGGEGGTSDALGIDGGAAGDGGSAIACDDTRSPVNEMCRVSEEVAIFVSPTGDNTHAGTRDAPLETLTKAIELAAAAGKAVIACTGTFQENITIRGDTQVKLYGGFACGDGWRTGAARTRVAPQQGIPLTIESASAPVLVEGVDFIAPDATVLGQSSIAVRLVESADVTLRNLMLNAGKGAAGGRGITLPFTLPEPEALQGNAATRTISRGWAETGGLPCSLICPSGHRTVGGRGGDGDPDGSAPGGATPGLPGLPDHQVPGGKAGALALECNLGGRGGNGAAAPPASDGAGARDWGLLDENGWHPRDGSAGADGAPGQGGGGGRGGSGAAPDGGGGGGCGGCGGKGGAAGKGAGSSIALLVFNSQLLVDGVELVTGAGGAGGHGGDPQLGQAGGLGGLPYRYPSFACAGGLGGAGATGGGGGGGAGGLSVGVIFKGARPNLLAVNYKLGTGGAPGLSVTSDATALPRHAVGGQARELVGL